MIVVIADDITGAAEMAGLGLQHGLNVEMCFSADTASDADMLVIATDTRSLPEEEAVTEVVRQTGFAKKLSPSFIYKKTDSVLRGHVLAELKAQMGVLGMQKGLIIPANPSMQRIVRQGIYYVNGTPINETGFAHDPEFPAKSASVKDILRGIDNDLISCSNGDLLINKGIYVADTESSEELEYWANNIGRDVLIAGGAGFFTAWLKHHTAKNTTTDYPAESPLGNKVLYVCGTAFSQTHEKIKKQQEDKANVCYMPVSMANGVIEESGIIEWGNEILKAFSTRSKVIVAIPPSFQKLGLSAVVLRKKMALVVSMVMQQLSLNELLIEGGSSGYAILQELDLKRFSPVQLLAPGVLRLESEERAGFYLTLKPGSYQWPDYIWQN